MAGSIEHDLVQDIVQLTRNKPKHALFCAVSKDYFFREEGDPTWAVQDTGRAWFLVSKYEDDLTDKQVKVRTWDLHCSGFDYPNTIFPDLSHVANYIEMHQLYPEHWNKDRIGVKIFDHVPGFNDHVLVHDLLCATVHQGYVDQTIMNAQGYMEVVVSTPSIGELCKIAIDSLLELVFMVKE